MLPATIVQAPFVYRLRYGRKAVAAWHAALPCSGTIVSIAYSGDTATAVFRLGQRGKRHTCTTPGALAAARFEIKGGRIVFWEEVPVPAKASPRKRRLSTGSVTDEQNRGVVTAEAEGVREHRFDR